MRCETRLAQCSSRPRRPPDDARPGRTGYTTHRRLRPYRHRHHRRWRHLALAPARLPQPGQSRPRARRRHRRHLRGRSAQAGRDVRHRPRLHRLARDAQHARGPGRQHLYAAIPARRAVRRRVAGRPPRDLREARRANARRHRRHRGGAARLRRRLRGRVPAPRRPGRPPGEGADRLRALRTPALRIVRDALATSAGVLRRLVARHVGAGVRRRHHGPRHPQHRHAALAHGRAGVRDRRRRHGKARHQGRRHVAGDCPIPQRRGGADHRHRERAGQPQPPRDLRRRPAGRIERIALRPDARALHAALARYPARRGRRT